MNKFEHFRAQFPALQRVHQGETLVFMDGPGGTQVPNAVIQAVSKYYEQSNANLHGAFITSMESDEVVDACRSIIATFLGAVGPECISIGHNMTSLNFALSRGIGRVLQAGDEILITQLDHESNRGPWLALREQGIIVKEIRLLSNGYLDYGHFVDQLSERTRLVAMGYASNFMGTVNNIQIAREQAHRVGAWLLLDAVHYAPHFPIDVQQIGCDFLLCSAYKFYGPHLGFLYTKPDLLNQIPTDRLRTAPQHAPHNIETGTMNHAAMAGVSAAIQFLSEFGEGKDLRARLLNSMASIQAHERALLEQLYEGLRSIKGLRIVGPGLEDKRRTPTLGITLSGFSPSEVCKYLATQNICAWNGHFYAQRASEILGYNEKGGVTRLGLSAYSNEADVDRVIKAIGELVTKN